MDPSSTLDAIFPISALQKKQREVKKAASKGIVRITEQGVGAYIFSTEEQYDKAIRKAREEAVFEARMHDSIVAGRDDKEAGRVHTDHAQFFESMRERLR